MRSFRPYLVALAVSLPFSIAHATSAGQGRSLVAEAERLEAAGDLEEAVDLLAAVPADAAATEAVALAAVRHRLLHRLRRWREAETAGERWLELAGETNSPDELARALWRTGRTYAAQGLEREAAARFERALAALGATADEELVVELRIDHATVLGVLGEYRQADAALAAAARSPLVATDARLATKLFSARGTLLERAGDPLGALEARQAAFARAREADEGRYLVIAAINLAQSELALDDYAHALATLDSALAVDAGAGLRATALVTAGIARFELNRLDEAEAAFEEASRLADSAGNAAVATWAQGEIGLVRAARGDAVGALVAFDRAIAGCRRSGDRRNEAIWWSNKGKVRREQGRWREALELYERAEALERRIEGQRPHPGLIKQIGQCRAGLGELEAAESLFLEARDAARQRGDTKVLWQTERELARLYADHGRQDEALAAAFAALDGIESIRGALRLETFESDFFEDKVGAYLEAIDLALAVGGDAGAMLSFAVAERARARAFLGSLAEARARLEQTLPFERAARERELLLSLSQIQAKQRRGDEPSEAAAAIAQLERALEQLELGVRAERPRFAEIRGALPPDLAAVQGALARGELVAAYLLAEPESHLWLVDGQKIRHHALPSRAAIEQEARRAIATLVDPATPPNLDPLAASLLAPLAGLAEPPSALLIVPWGILHYLPFEALPFADASLGESIATSYAPSASALVELRRRPVAPAEPRLLALGGAEYRGVDAATARGPRLPGRDELGALPFARREVERLRARFGAAKTRLLLGGEATEARVKAEPLETYSVVHLATHGFLDASSAARSGLVLGAAGEEDGVLQFREILKLRLAAELVTLSACESALGELVTGEGMVGLARAFFYAGTDSVVASLWNVSDEASAELMDVFYAGLADGLSKAEALRRARREIRSRPGWDHPYYWAPFVLLGRGENGVRVPRRRASWPLVAGGAALLTLLAVETARRRAPRRGAQDPRRPPRATTP